MSTIPSVSIMLAYFILRNKQAIVTRLHAYLFVRFSTFESRVRQSPCPALSLLNCRLLIGTRKSDRVSVLHKFLRTIIWIAYYCHVCTVGCWKDIGIYKSQRIYEASTRIQMEKWNSIINVLNFQYTCSFKNERLLLC